jgi:hypothetical protein
VITADRGKKGEKSQKLPLIYGRLKITHISMTPTLKNAGYKAHKQALLSVWPQIIKVTQSPKGTKVSLGYKMVDKGLSKVPWLSIDQKSFVIWCHEKEVKFSNA